MTRLDVTSLFPEAPKKQELAREILKQVYSDHEQGTVSEDGFITINLPHNEAEEKMYSHALIKGVLHVLGYGTNAKKPEGKFKITKLDNLKGPKPQHRKSKKKK